MIFWEYAADVADVCHEIGIKAVAVTAGHMCPEPRATFYRHMDAAIEVQLPFLQRVLATGWTCVPLAVGATAPEQVADVLDTLCADGDTLPVVSTDLSHYLGQLSAERRDRHTAQAVVDRDAAAIGPHDACGVFALRGLVHWARRHQLDVRLLHLGTSADAGADPARVVGYGAFALLASNGSQLTLAGG